MLSDGQLKYLESYCAVNGVTYYDLQLEVIDHIATVIEDIQAKDPSIDFKAALLQSNTQFNKNDFRLLVKNKKQQLQKKVSRLIEKEFISFFTVPRIVLTAVLYLEAWLLGNNFRSIMAKSELAGIVGIVLLASPIIYYFFRYSREIKLLKYDRETNLLCLRIRSKYEVISIAAISLFNFSLNGTKSFFDVPFYKSDPFPVIIILFLVTLQLLYIAILHVRFEFNNKMRTQYPLAYGNN